MKDFRREPLAKADGAGQSDDETSIFQLAMSNEQ
jgi:hypothetical protein